MRRAFCLWCMLFFSYTSIHAADKKDLDYVRTVLLETYDRQGVSPAITTRLIAPVEVKRLLATRVDVRLASSAVGYYGEDLKVIPSGDTIARQAGVLTVSYRTHAIAVKKQALLPKSPAYFKKTKILTPYAAWVHDKKLIILFSENAGDPEMSKIIASFQPQK
jgi:hypothetical protein